MRIYKMTATFGKLEHETLTLEPGLNVIEAPNEWGKTTWCAFLMAMLYGLDTRAKTTKSTLADKEKYAPWSGSPMAGRIDLCWNGRDITIERSSKGRTPMGIFRAYETQSGLAVSELTGANCGAVLLGAEQSVYQRTGFIRQSDMPVTQDEALRRRLNALVTTGDETGDSDRLAAELKELKNKCRYNRTGLLPQAEARRQELQEKQAEQETLWTHSLKLKERLGETKSWIRALENHRSALHYAAAEEDAARVAQARELRDRAEKTMTLLEQSCAKQPSREDVERKIRTIQSFQEDLAEYQRKEAALPPHPVPPVPPDYFRGMTLEQARDMVEQDSSRYVLLTRAKLYLLFMILALVSLVFCMIAGILEQYLISGLCLVLGAGLLFLGLGRRRAQQREAEALARKYGSENPDAWMLVLQRYEEEKKACDQALMEHQVLRGDLDIQRTFLQRQRESLFGSQQPEAVLEIWLRSQRNWNAYDDACREYARARQYLQTLQEMAKPAGTPPAMEDTLTFSAEETEKLLLEARTDQQRLQNRLGQYQGRMEALGDPAAFQTQLQETEQRIRKLENIYSAVSLALDTLEKARQELQRRFAPRIARRARELLGKMTGGRYDRLSISADLSLLAAAQQEETLHDTMWRSAGTADQLYVALRLAVAEELIPKAPLVLDDAFVRYDDGRLKAALAILQEEAKKKQVILFTCQHRESEMLKQ